MPERSIRLTRIAVRPGLLALFLLSLCLLSIGVAFSNPSSQESAPGFKVGERLTYTVGFEKFTNVAYAEFYTVSRGKIGETEAVELRARFKTLDFLSAAFYLIDESRTIFVAPDTALPLYLTRTQYTGGLPKESIQNNLTSPTGNYDLVTLIYKMRSSEGAGSINIYENERVYPVTFHIAGVEKIKTDAGEFDTSLVSIQSEYFNELGIREPRINFSNDEARIPVAIRFRTTKGEFRARIASIQNVEPQPEASPTPTPLSTPKPTPGPTATPNAYTENIPLPPELSFVLGETLEYGLTAGGQPVAKFELQATERKQFQRADSLMLTATVTEAAPGSRLLLVGDQVKAYVNPETLGPRKLEIKLTGTLGTLSQSVSFDERSNLITFKGTGQVEAPVGTHNILSLLYAIRSFNLKPSKDTSSPINDTRVAVFWDTKPYIFTLRPAVAESLTIRGEKVSAQLVSISTGNPQLDALNIKVWLSNDPRRVPLRFSLGRYQAELLSDKLVTPKSSVPAEPASN